jgi:PEP-CTERM motif
MKFLIIAALLLAAATLARADAVPGTYTYSEQAVSCPLGPATTNQCLDWGVTGPSLDGIVEVASDIGIFSIPQFDHGCLPVDDVAGWQELCVILDTTFPAGYAASGTMTLGDDPPPDPPAPTPEPASLVLLGLGLLAMGSLWRMVRP